MPQHSVPFQEAFPGVLPKKFCLSLPGQTQLRNQMLTAREAEKCGLLAAHSTTLNRTRVYFSEKMGI